MPIRFEQPSPVAAAGAVGALQGRALAGRQAAAAAAQNLAASVQLAGLQQRAGEAQMQYDLGRGREELGRDEMELRFAANREALAAAAERQQAEMFGRMQLVDQELTAKERMRLQRLKTALADVAEDVRSGVLTREEGNDLMVQLRTGINPLEQRLVATTLKQKELQNKEMQEQLAMLETTRHLNESFAAGNVNQLPLIKDPATGKAYRMMRNTKGEWYNPFPEAAEPSPADQILQEQKVAKAINETAEMHAKAQVPPDMIGPDGKPTYSPDQAKKYGEAYHRMFREGWERYKGSPAGGDSKPPMNYADQAELQKAEIAGNPAIPQEVKMAAANAIDDARRLLEKVDWDISKLSKEDRERYDRLKNFVRSLPQQVPQSHHQAAPPPAPPSPQGRGPFDIVGAIQDANPFLHGPIARSLGTGG